LSPELERRDACALKRGLRSEESAMANLPGKALAQELIE
jgi:hypothetical protein